MIDTLASSEAIQQENVSSKIYSSSSSFDSLAASEVAVIRSAHVHDEVRLIAGVLATTQSVFLFNVFIIAAALS